MEHKPKKIVRRETTLEDIEWGDGGMRETRYIYYDDGSIVSVARLRTPSYTRITAYELGEFNTYSKLRHYFMSEAE